MLILSCGIIKKCLSKINSSLKRHQMKDEFKYFRVCDILLSIMTSKF